jgi:NADPH2 dehydrogenase
MPKFKPKYSRIAQLKTVEDFKAYSSTEKVDLPFTEVLEEGFSEVFKEKIYLKSGRVIGNRFCILPMEGWDATKDGKPTEFTKKRWEKFAISGAKLLFGCEAVAISHDAKANPRQLVLNAKTFEEIKSLREFTEKTHLETFGTIDDFVMGLQLTHSGRFCKPVDNAKFESKTVYAHPILDQKFNVNPETQILTDAEIDGIVALYIETAVLAQKAGFHFIDVKHCHGYLGHEILSAVDRPGKYGGSLENRTRYMRDIITGIKDAAPGMELGMRISAADLLPFKKGFEDQGTPELVKDAYNFAFGADSTGLKIDLTETKAVLKMAQDLGVELVCVTAGSPYYNPHVTRPALFPPSDGYLPPEEPLLGVQRHIEITAELQEVFPDLILIGSGYTYLQEWLPNVAHAVLKAKKAAMIGLGRMVLSYPSLPADLMEEKLMARNLICRTFSDCTTAPRNGMISGCFPLDPYYKKLPIALELKELKAKLE